VPQGAGTFYAFANVEKAMNIVGVKDDNAFAEHLLTHRRRRRRPRQRIRRTGSHALSFACSMQTLEEASRRMEKTLRAAQAALRSDLTAAPFQ
jgi:aspartate aminotransferase